MTTLTALDVVAPVTRMTAVPCGYCGAGIGTGCVTTTDGAPARWTHRGRWDAVRSASRHRQAWYALLGDDPRFGLVAGDIVRCVNYPYDAKVTVLFREEDGYDPECNQYLRDVAFLGFVPRDMEVPLP